MAFLSANTFSYTTLNCSKLLPISNLYLINNNTPNSNSMSISFPRNQLITACISSQTPNPSNLFTNLLSTHKKISKMVSKNAVKLLVGSILLVGCTCTSLSYINQARATTIPAQNEESGAHQESEELLYVKLLEKEPRNVEALKVLVNVKMRNGETKEGVKYVEKLIEIEPQQVEWRLLQALCYEMMGNFGKAKRLFCGILKKHPLLLRALHGLAMVMHKNHEGEAVFDMLNQALEVASREERVTEERNIKILIAQMHLVKGNLDEALKKYRELIDENPRDFRPYLCQGIIYSLQDKKEEADEQFEIYKSLVPEEFPQRGFLEDVVLTAKTESREQLEKEFKNQFSYKR